MLLIVASLIRRDYKERRNICLIQFRTQKEHQNIENEKVTGLGRGVKCRYINVR